MKPKACPFMSGVVSVPPVVSQGYTAMSSYQKCHCPLSGEWLQGMGNHHPGFCRSKVCQESRRVRILQIDRVQEV